MAEQPTEQAQTPPITPAKTTESTAQAPSLKNPNHWKIWHTLAMFALVAAIITVGIFIKDLSVVRAWLLIMLAMIVFTAIAGQGIVGLWRGLVIDELNMISLSRVQLLMWTILVLSALMDL